MDKDKTGLIMMRIPPDEVIDFMLKARINKQWDKFFLYTTFPAQF